MAVLAIDQGTSSTKALVVGDDGAVIAAGSAAVNPQALGDGAVEQDAHELLGSILTAGREAMTAAGVEVSCVGLANQGETVLHWDPASGDPLGPAVSWQDTRASVIATQLQGHAARLEEICGLPLDPYFAAPKMTWLRGRVGDRGVITTLDVWINHQLTSRFVTDAATASRTMLLDLDQVQWSPEAMSIFEIGDPPPEIVGCAEPIGETDAFGPRLPLTGLIVDQQAALVAERCFSEGEAKCTYGTGAFLLANAGKTPIRSSARLAASVAWLVGGETAYCLDGQVYTAGAAVAWLSRIGLLADAAEIDPLLARRGAKNELPTFVPALAGLGAPEWQPQARGAWVGLSLACRREDLVAAVVWGIAAQVALLVQAMNVDLLKPLQRLRVDGGLSSCAALMQAQADLLQIPVECYPSTDATALGVAALAKLGNGEAASLAEATGRWQPSSVYEPGVGPDQAQERLAHFSRVASMIAAGAV